jgi:hypothetical protein
MKGDPDAWLRLREYNERDVEVLEEIYERVQPWVNRVRPNGQFNWAHFAEEGANMCPSCGGRDTLVRGPKPYRTAVSEFPELWCKPPKGCGARPRMRFRHRQYDGGVKAR